MPKEPTRLSSVTKFCQYCKNNKKARGFARHQASCAEKEEQKAELKKLANIPAESHDVLSGGTTIAPDLNFDHLDSIADLHMEHFQSEIIESEIGGQSPGGGSVHVDSGPSMDVDIPHPVLNGTEMDANFMPEIDDIKVEFHPKTGRQPQYYRFDKYPGRWHDTEQSGSSNLKPWEPFRTRLDFEIAELMLDCHMNSNQSTALLSLLNKVIKHPDDFTLSSSDDLEKVWTDARELRATGFEHKMFTAKYKDEDIVFQVSKQSIWNWIEELVDNPNVVPSFTWHAERHYRYDGLKWMRFVDEPWTADDWWNIE